MKITIVQNPEEQKDEIEMKLYLENDGGTIRLRGIDGNKMDWIIGSFRSDGLHMAGCITAHGWKLTKSGQLKVYGDRE